MTDHIRARIREILEDENPFSVSEPLIDALADLIDQQTGTSAERELLAGWTLGFVSRFSADVRDRDYAKRIATILTGIEFE